VSLQATAIAMVFIFILGLLAAWATIRMSNRWKGVVDTILTIPMVLPPTVCGFLLLLVFGKSTGIGRWLIAHGVDLVFTFPAVVISCIVVAFPLMYRTARGAFESLDADMLDAARTLGWSESRIFRTLMMPLTWPSIAAGTVLAFARSMGEFGATLFFAGNYAGVTQTIPIAIYFDWMAGDKDAAIFWVGVVILISFLVILFVNTYSARTQKWKKPAAGPKSRAGKAYGSESR
jgi:molybdate transport system permease protein